MDAFGKYQVVDQIGEGGFGRVYKGWDPVLKRHVAIKTCSFEDSHLRERFVQEAEIAAGLRHPNIVTVHDFGDHEGEPYLVQEFLEGEDLNILIGRGEPGDLHTKLSYLRQVAEGLQFAHAHGVVHRDVKPANVRIEPDGRVRIMDFGIAKLLGADRGLTQTGMSLGTDAYVSPEQLRGLEIDHRTDIFSFGVLAYELVVGRRPFEGDTISSLHYQIAHEDPLPVREARPDCPPRLAACIERCLSKDRDERFGDFSQVVAELDASSPAPAPTVVARPRGPRRAEPREEESVHEARRGLKRGYVGLLIAAGVVAVFGILNLARSSFSDPSPEELADGSARDDTTVAVLPTPPSSPDDGALVDDTSTDDVAGDASGGERTDPSDPSSGRQPADADELRDAGGGADRLPDRDPTPDPLPDDAAAITSSSGVLVLVYGEAGSGYDVVENVLIEELSRRGYEVWDQASLEMGAPGGASGLDAARIRELGQQRGVAVVVLGTLETEARPFADFYTGSAKLSLRTYETSTGRLLSPETFEVGSGGIPGRRGQTAASAMTEAARQVGYQASSALLQQLRDRSIRP
jgi:serine/threonine protein kinase